MTNEPQIWDDFLTWKPQYPDSIIGNGLLYEQTKLILFGKYKSFKSMAAMNLMLSLSSGAPWMGFETRPTRVLYLQLEMPHSLLHKRLSPMYESWVKEGNEIKEPFWVWSEPYLKLDTRDGMARIEHYLDQYKPGLLIVDPLYKVLSGDILNPNQVRALADSIDQIIPKYNVSVMLCHHPRKSAINTDASDMDWGSDDMLGSAVFSWWADSILKLSRESSGKKKSSTLTSQRYTRLTLSADVIRYAEEELEPREVVFDRDSMLFTTANQLILV